ncbi:MAG: hypothetical protein US54_C0002G0016 [Candidatus Roizmanbacteria bacterium GW2011_GWA2_37_7]|uniref:IPT/TIG domain-containing protein n=1 Tax=Candidatus Roizmanbacteria bacterium GW2011_GWA2_37_7 TaxID=1618481 RepID=A0A0G0H6D6_9BACT|nr:MAG: hypothetical protein US54_C0002G0016 [Candidatus Roizmanbacteria bacterium GW2011_GWA2_37_7]
MQTKHHITVVFLDLLWRSLYIISSIIFLYFFISYLLITVNPTTLFIDVQIFTPKYLRYILGVAFLLAALGWWILKLLHKIKFQSPWHLNRMEKILTISSAVILGYIYGGSLETHSVLAFVMFIAFSIIFTYLIPQLINFYSYLKISDLKYFLIVLPLTNKFIGLLQRYISVSKENINEHQYTFVITKKQIRILALMGISIIFIVFLTLMIITVVYKYTSGQIIRENKLRKTFYISSVEPENTTPGRTAKLIGYNFGFKTDKNYRVLTDDGIILEIVTWDKDFIEFIIPLSLQTGEHKIWIVRPTDELHREQGFKKSNQISLKIHSRFALLPDVGDSDIERGVKKIKRYLIEKYPNYSWLIFFILQYE